MDQKSLGLGYGQGSVTRPDLSKVAQYTSQVTSQQPQTEQQATLMLLYRDLAAYLAELADEYGDVVSDLMPPIHVPATIAEASVANILAMRQFLLMTLAERYRMTVAGLATATKFCLTGVPQELVNITTAKTVVAGEALICTMAYASQALPEANVDTVDVYAIPTTLANLTMLAEGPTVSAAVACDDAIEVETGLNPAATTGVFTITAVDLDPGVYYLLFLTKGTGVGWTDTSFASLSVAGLLTVTEE